MTAWELSAPFVLGLVGSLHCMQMCGPLVFGYSLPMAGQRAGRQWLAHAAYNTGRIITYCALGAAAGALGGAVGLLGRVAGIANAAAIVSGVLLVAFSLALARWLRWPARAARPRASAALSRFAARWLQAPGVGSKLTLGLALGSLPCGLVYAALVQAAATAGPLTGAATMLAFGLGTAPALIALAACPTTFGRRLGRWSPQLAAASVLILGVALIWRGLAGIEPASAAHVHAHH